MVTPRRLVSGAEGEVFKQSKEARERKSADVSAATGLGTS